MTLDYRPLWIAGIIGIILILIRFWRTVYFLWIRKLLIKCGCKSLLKVEIGTTTSSPLFDRIIEYLITISVTFFSFYSAYLLSVKKGLDDDKNAAIELLKQAELRCSSLESVLETYTKKLINPARAHDLTDSEVVTNYCNNSIVQPFYLTDVVKPEKMLTYLSPRTLEVLSDVEESQRVAHNKIIDTTLSFLQRHISFIAFMKFEFLRDSLIRSERLSIQDSILPVELEVIQEHINKRDSIISNAVDPFLLHPVSLDTITGKLNNVAEDSGTDIEGDSEIDSLWRYSYLMIGKAKGKPFITMNCFFLKKSRRLYLVSTYHSMTSWQVWDTSRRGVREKFFPDTFNLRLYARGNHACVYIPIDISKIKRQSKRILGYSEPDIYLYPISDTSIENKYEINTIDTFNALNRSKYQRPTEVIVVGSPMRRISSLEEIANLRAEIHFSQILGFYEINVYYSALQNTDSINYRITPSLDYSYWGAPIFFKEIVPDGDKFKQVLIFGGIYTGPEVADRSGMAVRPEQILKRFALLK